MEKQRWEPPKLVVLVRAKPEESVLLTCKASGGGAGPDTFDCRHNPAVTGPQCDDLKPS